MIPLGDGAMFSVDVEAARELVRRGEFAFFCAFNTAGAVGKKSANPFEDRDILA